MGKATEEATKKKADEEKAMSDAKKATEDAAAAKAAEDAVEISILKNALANTKEEVTARTKERDDARSERDAAQKQHVKLINGKDEEIDQLIGKIKIIEDENKLQVAAN